MGEVALSLVCPVCATFKQYADFCMFNDQVNRKHSRSLKCALPARKSLFSETC